VTIVADNLPPTESDAPNNLTNISGGVNLDAQRDVSIGGDVVGRDKIVQIHAEAGATVYIGGEADRQTALKVEQERVVEKVKEAKHWVIGGLEFVPVPAGQFIMGSERNDDEMPQHMVEIPYDYWLARYPVTKAQFAQFVKAAAYQFKLDKNWEKKASHPVVNVSWQDAMAYCKWLSDTLRGELKDQMLRLPTEAEWEKAARGTQGYEWPWGNEFDKNKCNSIEHKFFGGTTLVGAYSPQGDSPCGAADMAGNVWEWSHSLLKPYPYKLDDGRESEAEGTSGRVLRGGSFRLKSDYVRGAGRLRFAPRDRDDDVGLRVVIAPVLS
jgi:formylglycine-generating enzyme required for sulfatase activity